MPVVNTIWAELTDAEVQTLEAWLVEFDRSWDERRLAARVQQLPPPGSRLRLPALVEMVKIDLEKHWSQGRRSGLEAYLHQFPELGTPETVSVELVQTELEVRRQLGDGAALADIRRRFPRQAQRLDQVAPPPTAAADELPEEFGRYRILKKLGQGGMGAVYLAHDTQLDRRIALKVPFLKGTRAPALLQRFNREARAAATLEHPNLCPIHDVGEINGLPFLTMAFIEGQPLSAFVGQPLPPLPVAALVRQLAVALNEAHAHGVVHRDLKPANIMINQRREPIIMDFGLARRLNQEEARLTQDGHFLGTPAYMAPEQIRGEPEAQGSACDIYALGVILYELLTGQLPFQGPVMAVVAQILSQEPEPPTRHRPDLDPRLEAICLKAMARNPADRYASMAELAAALGPLLQGPECLPAGTDTENLGAELFAGMDTAVGALGPTREVSSWPRKPPARKRRLPWAIAGAVLGVTLLGAVLYVATNNGTIRIELSDPNAKVEVKVDGANVEITGLDKPLRLRATEHDLVVSGDGFETISRKFTVRRGNNSALTVELKPKEGSQPAELKPDAAWVTTATGKVTLPEAGLLRTARERLREAYKAELASTKREDRARLAQTLVERATAPDVALATRYPLLDLARQAATEAGDVALALSICDRIGQGFLVDLLAVKAATVKEAVPVIASRPQSIDEFMEAALPVGFEALALDDYESAGAVAAATQPVAGKSRAKHWIYQTGFLADEVVRGRPAYERVRPFLATLQTQPEDPAACTEVGKYLCLIKNEWDRGLPLLARGSDAALKALAVKEQSQAPRDQNVAANLELADGWWDAAGNAAIYAADYRERAKHWYLRALTYKADRLAVAKKAMQEEGQYMSPDVWPLPGDIADKEQGKKILERIDSIPSRPVTLRVRVWNQDGHVLRINSDRIVSLVSLYTRPVIQVNHLRWTFSGRGSGIKNAGATRFMPGAVDFSTGAEEPWAHVGRWGELRSGFLPSLVLVNMGHEPSGNCDIDVTYSFQDKGLTLPERLAATWQFKLYEYQKGDLQQGEWERLTQGEPKSRMTVNQLNFTWCIGVRKPKGIASEHFAAVATTTVDLPEGKYEVQVFADDGVRCWIDDEKVIDHWPKIARNQRAEVKLKAGQHRFRLDYCNISSDAELRFRLRRLEE